MNPTAERHLSIDDFSRYLRTAVPIEHPIPGTPRLLLFTDPGHARIGLRGQAGPHESPPASGLENLNVRTVHYDAQRMIEIAVTDPVIFTDAYPLLCAVADRVQLDGQTLTHALAETMRRLGHLLRREERPSHELETGLFGELCVVAGCVRANGTSAALQAWRARPTDEHDFALPGLDLEVKTTTSERRTHWISSLTQLVPTGQRPLWLVSVQITRAGADGTTLAELIVRVRDLFVAAGDPDVFDARLRSAGWRDSYATQVQQPWRLRTAPIGFAVTAGFPRLTPELLVTAGIDPTHMPEVRYRLDLTGRPPGPCPADIAPILVAAQAELP
jgi:hypothetical protein